MSLSAGTKLGPYEIVAPLGAGGMGEVYEARDTRLHRSVAVKVLPAQLAADSDRLARFAHEARTASALNHPNIVTIHEIGEWEGTPYLVMERVDGETLRRLLAKGPIESRRLLDLATQIAEGLAKAHAAGIVHRDLKPENVMVTVDGFVKILDFGLAKLRGGPAGDLSREETLPRTVEGTIVGTVGYMSPEQAAGRPVDIRSDQFAFGSMLYEMIGGRRAFSRASAAQTLAAIIEDEPEPLERLSPSFPAQVRRILARCLAKDPAKRYTSTSDLAHELRTVRDQMSSFSGAEAAPTISVTMPRRRPVRAPVMIAAGVLLLAAVAAGVFRFFRSASGSIAVLPFRNLTGDAGQEYFADGITDGLISQLGRIGALRVTSLYSVMAYKDGKTPLREIARALGVATVVEGTVLRVGSDVSLRVRLVRALPEERSLWEKNYDRTLADILAMYGDIALALSREMEVPLKPREEKGLASRRPVNPEIYKSYLRGMALVNTWKDEETERGLAELRKAVERDPADPLAYVGLAYGYVSLGHGPKSPPDAWQRAREASLRALKLDDTLADAYATLADVKSYYERDWKGAEENFLRAMELNPSLAMNHYHYAWYLALFSRFDEAIAEHKRAQELDPLTPLHTAWLGGLYWCVGRYDDAIAEARKCLKLNGDDELGWLITGFGYAGKKMYTEAIDAHRKAVAVDPDWKYALARTFALAGRTAEARAIRGELESQPLTSFGAWGLAITATALGDNDKALEYLRYEPAHGWIPWARVDPEFEPLRRDPRFKGFLRKYNLPD